VSMIIAHVLFLHVRGWEEDTLPGWMGETYVDAICGQHDSDPCFSPSMPDFCRTNFRHRGRKRFKKAHAGGKFLMRGTDPLAIDPSKVIQLSWKPRFT
jgi:hypothetical protein